MRHLSGRTSLLALAVLLAAGPAMAVTGGNPDGGGHPFVGWIYGETAQGAQTTGCSGVLVAPTVVVTSGACADLLAVASNIDRVWISFQTDNVAIVGVGFDPPTTPPSVEVIQLVANPVFFSSGGASGNVGVAILDTAQSGPFADLPAAGRLDALTGSEVFTAVAYGQDRGETIQTLARRYSGADFRGLGADSLFLRLSDHGGGPPACIGSQNEGGGGFIGASEAAALVLEPSNGCARNATLQRLDVQNVRDFLDDYVTLP